MSVLALDDRRRIRFASLAGLEREDLPIACEVWLEDAIKAPWASRETMKLAAYFMRYMQSAASTSVSMRELETAYQLTKEEIMRSLNMLRMFMLIESFEIERDELRVVLILSLTQRTRTLSIRQQFADLAS